MHQAGGEGARRGARRALANPRDLPQNVVAVEDSNESTAPAYERGWGLLREENGQSVEGYVRVDDRKGSPHDLGDRPLQEPRVREDPGQVPLGDRAHAVVTVDHGDLRDAPGAEEVEGLAQACGGADGDQRRDLRGMALEELARGHALRPPHLVLPHPRVVIKL